MIIRNVVRSKRGKVGNFCPAGQVANSARAWSVDDPVVVRHPVALGRQCAPNVPLR
jgi:hypothetical protein